MVATAENYLGRGIYGFTEAGRLTHVSPQTVRAWFIGRHKHGKPVGRGRVFESEYDGDRVISFLDLIEVLLAGHLRKAGVSLSKIRKIYESLASVLDSEHPFSRQEMLTDGHRLFVETVTALREMTLIEVIDKQHFFPSVMRPYLSRVNYDPSTKLARSWAVTEGIVIDPGRSRGKPIVETSAIPAEILSAAYDANSADADAVADWYGVTVDDVKCAVAFASR